jgi:hypothetical protein
MTRAVALALAALLLAAVPAAVAAQPPQRTPAEIAERIDHYRFNPRTPGAYRALAGMGDPDGAAEQTGADDIPLEQRRLLARMLPGQQPLDADYWYPRPGLCRTDYALSVAEARVARFGANHAYVEQWLRAQRAVFSVCQQREHWRADDGPAPGTALPPPMATDDAEIARLQRDDRAYQAASLLFYRDDPGARQAFAAIARSSSPHAPTARYMLAALHVSYAEFHRWDEDPARKAERSGRALVEAEAILADPALHEVHALAQGLIGFVGYHMADERSRAAQVDATLDALEAPLLRIDSDPVAADRYARASADIHWLHRRFDDEAWWLGGSAPRDAPASRAMAVQAQTRPLAAFLLFPVSHHEREPWAVDGPADYQAWADLADYAQAQEQREPGEAWALVHSSLADIYDEDEWPEIDALVRATQAEPTDRRLASVATRFYHQVRRALKHDLGTEPRWRQERDEASREALSRVESWPWRESGHYRELVADMLQYLIARGRLTEARLLRDRSEPRGELYYGATAPMLILLAEDEDQLAREIVAAPEHGQELLNLLSTDALTRLARRGDLPRQIRARFARVAWTRLYALQRAIPRPLDRLMRDLNPEVTGTWTSRPGARPNSRPLLLDVLRSPGLNIVIANHQRGSGQSMGYSDAPGLTAIDTFEHSDNNWWCAWQLDRHGLRAATAMYDSFFAADAGRYHDPLAAAGAPSGLGPLLTSSWLWRARDEPELAALAGIASAPQTLAERAVAWRGQGSRAGQDEALALAVRATRYGCQRQGGHGAWSRAAHALLHRRFPGSDAARRTRWWFDCSHFSGGCPATRERDPDEWTRWTYRIYWPVRP